MKKPISYYVSEEIKRYCAEQRAEISEAQRVAGWDYDWIYDNGCIYGVVISPDGEIFDPIFLQRLDKRDLI